VTTMAEGRTGMPETQPFRGSWYVPRAARDLERKNRVFKTKSKLGMVAFLWVKEVHVLVRFKMKYQVFRFGLVQLRNAAAPFDLLTLTHLLNFIFRKWQPPCKTSSFASLFVQFLQINTLRCVYASSSASITSSPS